MAEIETGEVGSETAATLKYPGINSCLTITCWCNGPRLVGGHAILQVTADFTVTVHGQVPQTANQIINWIDSHTAPADRRHLYLIGDTSTWGAAGQCALLTGYADFNAIAQALGLAGNLTSIDVFPWLGATGGGMVDVEFSPIGFCHIRDHTTHHLNRMLNLA